jgi:serine/threonine-protein kinase
MTPERWQQLKQIYQSALERNPAERSAFLNQACADDPALRSEVESLISSHDQAGDAIEGMAVQAATEMLANDRTGPMEGRLIGRYQVLSLIGRGGMGEVFLAQDASLGRKVALKLLRAEFTGDEDRLRRFRQEARAASALNHPNILTIHEIGQDGSLHFMATEYVEGETLREHISRARMAQSQALDVAAQVAGALAAAHNAGIIHRDIKPENVMLRTDGYVKVLDFGLAKLTDRAPASGDSAWPVVGKVETNPGVVMGTVQYMSPEQARGLEVDARTDIFSLGVVIYEMVAGRAPFEGKTVTDMLVAILEKEPPPLKNLAPEQIPAELDRIITKTLRKNPDERYQTSKELCVDLQRLRQKLEIESHLERSSTPEASGAATRPNVALLSTTKRTEQLRRFLSTRRTILYVAVFTILILGAFASVWHWRQSSVAPQPEIRSLAVLPLRTLDANEDPSLGLKLADALIQRLGRLRQIVVRPTRSVQGYESKTLDPVAAGREQQVDVVLDGSFQRDGERLHLRVQLLRVSDGQQLWAKAFHEQSTDPFYLQDALAEQAAQALVPQLTGAERKLVAHRDTEKVEANRLYTEGRYHWNKRNIEGIRKSVELLEQAVALDPKYARAYAALADSYITLSEYGLLPASEAFPKARDAAQKALRIDDSLGEAHTALAMIKASYDWNWKGADETFQRAIELNPNYATAHQWYSEFLAAMGRHNEALSEIRRAQQIDPLSLIIQAVEAWILYYARDYDGMLAQSQRIIERDPTFGEAYAYLGLAYEQKGMFRQAMDAFQKYSTLMGYNTPAAAAIRAKPISNTRDYWQRLAELAKPPTGSEFDGALALAQLGESDKALDLLERAYKKRDDQIMYLKVNPNLDPIRSDPRFKDLLRRVVLAE